MDATTDKLDFTMQVFDEYENRFSKKRLEHKNRKAWQEEDKAEIKETLKAVLKFDDNLIPKIKVIKEQEAIVDGIKVKHLLFESWARFYGVATLFIPDESSEHHYPAVIVCPGHGKKGRLTTNYQKIAANFAKRGTYALLLENIGQGCRERFGHSDLPEVFYCGLTVQGLIIAETMAWIDYLTDMDCIDNSRIGVCGNSGGGTLVQFLAALDERVAAAASCGYPSEYEYIMQKERRHCDCNLFCGIIGKLEMWEVYSLFAPKPLLLDTGINDQLIPVEYFYRNSRKIRYIYEKSGASQNFHFKVTDTHHSWDTQDMIAILNFFENEFNIKKYDEVFEFSELSDEDIKLKIPHDAITTAYLAQNITQITAPKGITLTDIFKPVYKGRELTEEEIVNNLGRGSVMRVFTQFEMALSD